MASKIPKKKGGKSKSRATSTKVANKKLNKFAKQGKLRKQRLKQKKKEGKLSKRSEKAEDSGPLTNGVTDALQEEAEAEESLEEEDVEFYSGQNAAFIHRSGVQIHTGESTKGKKRRRAEVDDDCVSKYEKKARRLAANSGPEMKMLLPIKEQGRVIPQMMEVPEEKEDKDIGALPSPLHQKTDEGGCGEGSEVEEEAAERLGPVSRAQLKAQRTHKLEEKKERIGQLCMALLENPEDNIGKMKELRKLLGETDPAVFVTVRKLVMTSIGEVLSHILPSYRLRLPSQQEREQRMKQETKKLMDYEAALLLSYKTYIDYLEYTLKGKSFDNCPRMKKLGFCDIHVPHSSKTGLSVVAAQCLCNLLKRHPHFNYRSDVVATLVPFMNHANPKISDCVCQTVKEIFVTDKAGQVCLEIVKSMSKFLKSKKFEVQPKMLKTLLSLKIKEINPNGGAGTSKKMSRKEKFQKLSRRERKRQKQKDLLDKELEETKATQDHEERLRVHTDIIQTMFTSFFKVLKAEERSPLLPVVLEAFSKFTHLINVDLFHDLFRVFYRLIDSGELSQLETLHCVRTAFNILSGQGSALTIDPVKFYAYLYRATLLIHAGSSPDDAALLLDCVDAAIVKRKRQVSRQRVLAFIKRVTLMALHQLPPAAAAYLAFARCAVSMFSDSSLLFEADSEGSGVYQAYLEEAEHCGADNAVLWELLTLKNHYHPNVRQLATALLHRRPSNDSDLCKKTPAEILTYIEEKDLIPASLPEHAKQKTGVRMGGLYSQTLAEKIKQTCLENGNSS